ncbi:MAG TPA: hypothetical protein PK961_16350 [bacterium]|nr:hypothetical protein [bacterium]
MRYQPSPGWNRKIPPLEFESPTAVFLEAIDTFTTNFGLYAKIILSVFFPLELIFAALSHFTFLGKNPVAGTIVFLLMYLLAGSVVVPALATTALTLWQTGARPTLGSIYGRGLRRCADVFVTRLALWLATIIGLALLIVPGVWIMIRFFLAPMAASLHPRNGPEALRESVGLSEGRYQIIGLSVALGAAAIVAVIVLSIILGLITRVSFCLRFVYPLFDLFFRLLGDLIVFIPAFIGLHLYVAWTDNRFRYFRHIEEAQRKHDEEITTRPLSLSGAEEDVMVRYNREQAQQAPDAPAFEQHREPLDVPEEDPFIKARQELLNRVTDDGPPEFELVDDSGENKNET